MNLINLQEYCYIALPATILMAFVVAFFITPLVSKLAGKVGAIDDPHRDEQRRIHKKPIPRLGGLAIFAGFMAAMILFSDITLEVAGMLIGAVIIVVLGFCDDIKPLPAWFKFVVQIIASTVPVIMGVTVEYIQNPFSSGEYISFGIFAAPLTIFWIVGVTNAVNLIDGLDGLSAGVSAIASIFMLVLAVSSGQWEVAIFLGALAGASLGFLPRNLNPASIFMGDTGATFLGFILACVSVEEFFKSYMLIYFIVPFLVLGFPIFDTAFAIVRRVLKGQPPMQADRGHSHHRLLDMGLSQKQAVFVLYVVSMFLGTIAILLTGGSSFLQVGLIFTAGVAVVAVLLKAFLSYNRERKRRAQISEKSGGSSK